MSNHFELGLQLSVALNQFSSTNDLLAPTFCFPHFEIVFHAFLFILQIQLKCIKLLLLAW
ncbi:hypothetical protein Fmac_016379 [Flemingia macrophylla]|uniref:Uncharacterized protein n=1 Tax=Flemingia macrophylla TaxID=520843 RepID=A0ABD1MH98_9FABA